MSEVNGDNRLGDAEEVKQGRLDAKADIYQKRKTLTPSENVKNLSPKDKWYYFKDYYLKFLVLGLCLILLSTCIIYTMVNNNEDEELFVGYVDCIYDTIAAEAILEDFAAHLDMRYTTNDFAADSFISSWTDNHWLSDFVRDGTLDVLILDEELYKAYAACDLLLDLSDYIDTEEYSDYITYAPNSKGKDTPTAFQCDSIQIYSTESIDVNKKIPISAYLVVLENSSRIERSVEYLKYATTYEYKVSEQETK